MAEDLFKQLQDGNERFEVKLLHLDVISRLVGIHELFIFSFYPYVTRFLQPHQRQVTRILQFAAQAAHELVPPEVIEPVNKTIANNFVSERNSSDVMAIGLNAIREVCQRCPLSMDEYLLRDLAMYKNYKDKSVMMASRSLISLYREHLPTLLHKKDRGRPTEASVQLEPKKYGEVKALDFIPGTEVLLTEAKKSKEADGSDSDSESGSWVDVSHSENEEDIDEGSGSDEDEDESDEESEGDEEEEEATTSKEPKKDEKEAAKELELTKIFTDDDFKRIEGEQLKRKVTSSRKRKAEPAPAPERSEFVKLTDIERIYKKRRTDKEARMETVKKNFQMIRHKVRGKAKKSFRDKQMALRKHLIQQKKMK